MGNRTSTARDEAAAAQSIGHFDRRRVRPPLLLEVSWLAGGFSRATAAWAAWLRQPQYNQS